MSVSGRSFSQTGWSGVLFSAVASGLCEANPSLKLRLTALVIRVAKEIK